MTSRRSFFNWMKEDFKRRIWAFSLMLLGLFFVMPVSAAFSFSELSDRAERMNISGNTEIEIAEMMEQEVVNLKQMTYGTENLVLVFIMVTTAIVMALTGFSYLHSKKKLDFYHSLPIRREELFFVKYLNGILMMLAAYLIALLMTACVFVFHGYSPLEVMRDGMMVMGFHMVFYILNYLVTLAAVMLTGNFVVSVLGTIVLFGYLPALGGLINALCSIFFRTYGGSNALSSRLYGLSPISAYIMRLDHLVGHRAPAPGEYGILYAELLGPVLAILVLTAVVCWLYKKRASEAAGKAMAFRASMPVIKILIVTMCTLFLWLFFRSVSNSIMWASFGFVLALVISHCIIEIIYHMDFRKIFANPVHAGIAAVISLAVLGVFRFDVVGYDSYFPAEKKFDSAQFLVYILGEPGMNGYVVRNYDDGYEFRYIYENEYADEMMRVTDRDSVRILVENGIRLMKEESADEAVYTDKIISGEYEIQDLYMKYHLTNGKKAVRRYSVDLNQPEVKAALEKIYTSEEYKKGVYPVYTYDEESLNTVMIRKDHVLSEPELSAQTQRELLRTYKEELTRLSIAEKEMETPLFFIRFVRDMDMKYIEMVSRNRNAEYVGKYDTSVIADVNFFPVYPSFQGTISLLEQNGADVMGEFPYERIEKIQIRKYMGDMDPEISQQIAAEDTVSLDMSSSYEKSDITPYLSYEDGSIILTIYNEKAEDQEKIREIIDHSISLESASRSFKNMESAPEVAVFTRPSSGFEQQGFYDYVFKKGEIPDFVRDAFETNLKTYN